MDRSIRIPKNSYSSRLLGKGGPSSAVRQPTPQGYTPGTGTRKNPEPPRPRKPPETNHRPARAGAQPEPDPGTPANTQKPTDPKADTGAARRGGPRKRYPHGSLTAVPRGHVEVLRRVGSASIESVTIFKTRVGLVTHAKKQKVSRSPRYPIYYTLNGAHGRIL